MSQHHTTIYEHHKDSPINFLLKQVLFWVFVECLTFELPNEACDAVDMQVPTPLDSGSQKRSQLARPQLVHCDTVAFHHKFVFLWC